MLQFAEMFFVTALTLNFDNKMIYIIKLWIYINLHDLLLKKANIFFLYLKNKSSFLNKP